MLVRTADGGDASLMHHKGREEGEHKACEDASRTGVMTASAGRTFEGAPNAGVRRETAAVGKAASTCVGRSEGPTARVAGSLDFSTCCVTLGAFPPKPCGACASRAAPKTALQCNVRARAAAPEVDRYIDHDWHQP